MPARSSSDLRSSGELTAAWFSRWAPSGCPFRIWAIVVRRRSSWRSSSSSRGRVSAGSQIFASEAAAVSVPVLLEVAHERVAEMAVGLLARVGGHVLAEQLDRLLPDPHRGPVGGGVDQSGAGQRGYAFVDGLVHLAGFDDLVADQLGVRL